MYMRTHVHDVDFAACIRNSRCSLGCGYMQVADTMYPSRLAFLTQPNLGASREGSSLRHICHVAYYHMYVCIRYMYLWDLSSAGTFGQNALHLDSREPLGGQTWGEPSWHIHSVDKLWDFCSSQAICYAHSFFQVQKKASCLSASAHGQNSLWCAVMTLVCRRPSL